jgi:hypothetical protein
MAFLWKPASLKLDHSAAISGNIFVPSPEKIHPADKYWRPLNSPLIQIDKVLFNESDEFKDILYHNLFGTDIKPEQNYSPLAVIYTITRFSPLVSRQNLNASDLIWPNKTTRAEIPWTALHVSQPDFPRIQESESLSLPTEMTTCFGFVQHDHIGARLRRSYFSKEVSEPSVQYSAFRNGTTLSKDAEKLYSDRRRPDQLLYQGPLDENYNRTWQILRRWPGDVDYKSENETLNYTQGQSITSALQTQMDTTICLFCQNFIASHEFWVQPRHSAHFVVGTRRPWNICAYFKCSHLDCEQPARVWGGTMMANLKMKTSLEICSVHCVEGHYFRTQ